jgi:N-acetylglutamate synthase-like GNAT family acetyltransferase
MMTNSHRVCSEILFGSTEYQSAFALREEVLRKPLGISLNDETLEQERDYYHLVCHVDGELVGCLVLLPQGSIEVRMRQVAVGPHLQGQGIGRTLVEYAEQFARERGFSLMKLYARDTAIPFYEKLGYERVGEMFEEITILHCKMQKRL